MKKADKYKKKSRKEEEGAAASEDVKKSFIQCVSKTKICSKVNSVHEGLTSSHLL